MRHIVHADLDLFSIHCPPIGVPFMADDTAFANLHHALEHRCERVNKPTSTVLFRRGDKAAGLFVILSGKVSLELGVDSALCRTYGPGAASRSAIDTDSPQLHYDRNGDRGCRTRFLEF